MWPVSIWSSHNASQYWEFTFCATMMPNDKQTITFVSSCCYLAHYDSATLCFPYWFVVFDARDFRFASIVIHIICLFRAIIIVARVKMAWYCQLHLESWIVPLTTWNVPISYAHCNISRAELIADENVFCKYFRHFSKWNAQEVTFWIELMTK